MEIKQNYLLGVDLGTTNIKGILTDDDGNLIATATSALGKIFPGHNMVEQDPAEWWDAAVSILKEITTLAGHEIVNRIKGISVSSQCVTLLPVTSDGIPLRNAIIYQDGRAFLETDEICETTGFQKFVNIVGGLPSVIFLPGKLLWYKRNEPELFRKTYSILQANGWLNYKLTGEFTIDLDTATRTQCMNITTLDWSTDIGDAIGIDLATILPPVKKCTDIIGTVTPEAAALTGLKAGTPVVAGSSDAMASMYATGMCKLGDAGESSGTSSLVFASASSASSPDAPIVTRPAGLTSMPFFYDGPIGATGASIRWYLDVIGESDKAAAKALGLNMYDFVNKQALEVAAGSDGLLFFPYLVSGERAPLWNPHARGMFIGMTISTNRAHMIRSIFEGTGFALRHVMEEIKKSGGQADSLRITGGGAKSRTWNMIKASMLHMPVYVLDEGAGDVPLGDVIIAGHAVGVFPDLDKAIDKLIKINEIIQPVPEWEKVYDELYPYYKKMYAHLDSDLSDLKCTVDHITKELSYD